MSVEAWKFGNVEICLGQLNSCVTKLGSLEMWSLEQLNSYITELGSLEMWKYGD